jgi:hypothetical protein
VPFDLIPHELKQLQQWVCWKDGKEPVKPDGYAASSTNASTWSTFDACVAAVGSNGVLGIGYVFSENDAYAGIDLDAVKGEVTKERYNEILAQQIKIYNTFDSYSERSPSGNGCHIIVKGSVPAGRKRSCTEIYSSGRFFTFTGDVINNKPIAERDALLNMLWREMGAAVAVGQHDGNEPEKCSDAELLERAANASNGDKFTMLYSGEWSNDYVSQSEADQALMNILVFYTQNRWQAYRLFRQSNLGQRDKAKRDAYLNYTFTRALDTHLPLLNFDAWKMQIDEQLAQKGTITDAVSIPEQASSLPVPPGLTGLIAQYIYAASPRPVPEIAIAASIAFMAGLAGRAYNISATGLNHYVMLLAPTATGKEAMAAGISKLIAAVLPTAAAIGQFVGPGDLASGQALLKTIDRMASKSFLTIIGEFGYKLREMSGVNASPYASSLKRVMLDLYNKSGHGQVLQSYASANKDETTKAVASPAFSLLCESTPSTFFSVIDEQVIEDGLLPRFTIVEYTGPRVALNEDHASVAPSFALVQGLEQLVTRCGNNAYKNAVTQVTITPEAEAFARAFDIECDHKINLNEQGASRQLWSRCHVKMLKLAGLLAVGCNPDFPSVTLELMQYAHKHVLDNTMSLLNRLDAGAYGSEASENKQRDEVRKMAIRYYTDTYADVKKYSQCPKMHEKRVIPYAYFQRRLVASAAFRLDKQGATAAIKRTLQALIDMGVMSRCNKTQVLTDFAFHGEAYIVLDAAFLR